MEETLEADLYWFDPYGKLNRVPNPNQISRSVYWEILVNADPKGKTPHYGKYLGNRGTPESQPFPKDVIYGSNAEVYTVVIDPRTMKLITIYPGWPTKP